MVPLSQRLATTRMLAFGSEFSPSEPSPHCNRFLDFHYKTWVPGHRRTGSTTSAMKLLCIFQILSALTTVYSCQDHDGHADHVHSRRGQSQPSLITPPTRPLEWGDINIIHTTDSHGWLLGHQKASFPEPNYRYVALREFSIIKVTNDRVAALSAISRLSFLI